MQHGEPTGSYSARPTPTPEQMAGKIQRAEAQDQAQQASERAVEQEARRRQDIENEFAEAQGLVGQFDPYDFDNEAIEEEVAGPDMDDDDATVTNNNNALTSDSSPGKKRRVLTDEEVSAFRFKQAEAGGQETGSQSAAPDENSRRRDDSDLLNDDGTGTEGTSQDPHVMDPELRFPQEVPTQHEVTGRQTPRRESGEYDYDPAILGETYRKAAGLDSDKPAPEKEDE